MRQTQSLFDHLNQFYSCCSEQCGTNTCDGLAMSEDEEHFYIDAPMPGVKSEEIKVTVDPRSRHLFISGENKQERNNVKYHLRNCLNYNYEIPLSNEVNLEHAIEAVSKDGILSITLSKNRGHKPLKIDVKSS